MSILDAFYSLAQRVNRADSAKKDDEAEGRRGELMPEYDLDISDEEILKTTDKWKKAWDNSDAKREWSLQCTKAEEYWKGIHFAQSDESGVERPLVDNAIFEAVETFLPRATQKNPEPQVELDPTEEIEEPKDEIEKQKKDENEMFVSRLQKKLASLAKKLKIRLKVKKAARQWSIYLIGVAKIGWDMKENEITVAVRRSKRMVLDPDGFIDEDGYHGEFLGEVRSTPAEKLIKVCPDKEKEIMALVADPNSKGTRITWTEFWTPKYTVWRSKDVVLLKKRNTYWNWDVEEKRGEDGQVLEEAKAGRNHFSSPRMPYVFLSMFSLGDRPVDNTSLIIQNIPQQDLLNKRLRQIDRNADKMNGGVIVSLGKSGLTKEQAAELTYAWARGGTGCIPDGNPTEAVSHFQAPALPSDVFQQLADTRQRLSSLFGTAGSSAQNIVREKTVRGKMQMQQTDSDRIGGGISAYLEQFAGDIYEWFVQMMYVQYPNFQGPKVVVSVKEGSMIPKDTNAKMQQAIELRKMKAISLEDMYEMMEFPNPKQLAFNTWLEATSPQQMFKDMPEMQQLQQQINPPNPQ